MSTLARCRVRGGPAVNQDYGVTHKFFVDGNLTTQSYRPCLRMYAPFEHSVCYDHTNEKVHGRYVSGGMFDLSSARRSATSIDVNEVQTNTLGERWEAKGVLHPICNSNAYFGCVLPASNLSHLSTHGAAAWNKFKPGKPVVDSAVFLAELRDFPRMLQVRAKHFRDLGGNYLNVQFGWLPFVSDLRKMYQLAHSMEKQLAKIKQNNGKWLLRKGSVVKSSDVIAVGSQNSPSRAYFSSDFHPRILDTTELSSSHRYIISDETWFSGRFRYYIPENEIQRPEWRRTMIRRMYGLTLTPATVWELIPWSWLVDYFCSFGDIISNISSGTVDCVAKYAYVMGKTEHKYEQTSLGRFQSGKYITGTVVESLTTKGRVSASPFGFGLGDQLSGRQLAILAALGISRL